MTTPCGEYPSLHASHANQSKAQQSKATHLQSKHGCDARQGHTVQVATHVNNTCSLQCRSVVGMSCGSILILDTHAGLRRLHEPYQHLQRSQTHTNQFTRLATRKANC